MTYFQIINKIFIYLREERWIQFSNVNNIKSPVTTTIKSTSSSVTVSNKSPQKNITVS